MKVIYIAKNQTGVGRSFNDIQIEAWSVNPNYIDISGKKCDNLLMIERIKLHACRNPEKYHSCRFDWDRSENSCYGHYEKKVKAFIAARTKSTSLEGFKVVSRENYERYKRAILSLVNKYPLVDYNEIEQKKGPFSRQIM